jgi:hypothetical protein
MTASHSNMATNVVRRIAVRYKSAVVRPPEEPDGD